MPNEREVHLLMDGRLISNLQIEPALKCGAENVIALDMNDFREPPVPGPEVDKLITFWDFQQAMALIEQGYEAMQK
jgi:predicted acylesterase/phospholipase RssA